MPVFLGHSAAVNVEFENDIDSKIAAEILAQSPGINLLNENTAFTPIECVGEDDVFISRMRNDNTIKNTLNFWMVLDNLRKGAALNAVQIARSYIEKYI